MGIMRHVCSFPDILGSTICYWQWYTAGFHIIPPCSLTHQPVQLLQATQTFPPLLSLSLSTRWAHNSLTPDLPTTSKTSQSDFFEKLNLCNFLDGTGMWTGEAHLWWRWKDSLGRNQPRWPETQILTGVTDVVLMIMAMMILRHIWLFVLLRLFSFNRSSFPNLSICVLICHNVKWLVPK